MEHHGHASEVLSDKKISMALHSRNFLHWQFNLGRMEKLGIFDGTLFLTFLKNADHML
jgi:hypothetical protein